MALANWQINPSEQGRATIALARVSSHDQSDGLERQCQVLKSCYAAKGWSFELIRDLGSGPNYDKKGLRQVSGRIGARG